MCSNAPIDHEGNHKRSAQVKTHLNQLAEGAEHKVTTKGAAKSFEKVNHTGNPKASGTGPFLGAYCTAGRQAPGAFEFTNRPGAIAPGRLEV